LPYIDAPGASSAHVVPPNTPLSILGPMRRVPLPFALLFALLLPAAAVRAQEPTPDQILAEGRARNAALQQELQAAREKHRAIVDERQPARARRIKTAEELRAQIEKWYAADTPDYQRPTTEQVLNTLEELDEKRPGGGTYEAERSRLEAERSGFEQRRGELDNAMIGLQQTIAQLRERAHAACNVAGAERGGRLAAITGEAARIQDERKRLLEDLRTSYVDLLKESGTLLERLTHGTRKENRAEEPLAIALRRHSGRGVSVCFGPTHLERSGIEVATVPRNGVPSVLLPSVAPLP
jgi:hypothetical protein